MWNKDCVMNRSHAFQVGYFSLYLLSLFDRREWPFIDFNVFEVLNKTVRKYVRIQKCKSKRRQTLAMYRPYYTNLIHKRQAWHYRLGLISDLKWLPPYMMVCISLADHQTIPIGLSISIQATWNIFIQISFSPHHTPCYVADIS